MGRHWRVTGEGGEVGRGPQLRHNSKLDQVWCPAVVNTGMIMSEGWARGKSKKSGQWWFPSP